MARYPLAGALLACLVACSTPLLAGQPGADDLIKEFTGDADPVQRTPQQRQAAYAAVLDALLPDMGNEDPARRKGPEQTLERICWRAGRPGTEAERAAVCRAIVAKLKTDLPKLARIWLIRQLEHVGRDEAVDALATQLAHADATVRERARRALQRSPSPKAAEPLREALAKATTPEWRVALINALACRTDEPTVTALIAQAASDDDAARSAAIEALARIGDTAAAEAIQAGMAKKGSARARAVATDCTLLLADKLCAGGDKAAALAVYRKLLGAGGHVKCAALIGLGRAGGISELAAIFDALADKDRRVRGAGMAALELLPAADVVQAITARLRTAEPKLKVALLRALTHRADKATFPAFAAAATDADPAVRIAAYNGMAALRDERAAPVLVPALLKAQGHERDAAKAAANCIPGKRMTDALLRALASAKPEGRVELIRCIALRRADPVVPPLLKLAGTDPDAAVRSQAFEALAGLGDEATVPQLVTLLVQARDNADRRAAERAVTAVCKRIDDEARRTKPVLAALPGADVPARGSLLRVLGRLGGERALEAVRAALQHASPEIQDTAIRVLAKWDDPKVAADLLALAKGAKALNHRVIALDGYVRAVGMMADRPADELVKMYEAAMAAAHRPEDRKRVLAGMSRVGNLGALEMAQSYLDDPALKAEAEVAVVEIARAAGASHKQEAKAALEAILQSTRRKHLRKQAEDAIAAIERFDDYIVAWLVSGPYTKGGVGGTGLINVAFPPEKPDAKGVRWQPIPPGTHKKHPMIIEIDQVKDIRGNNRAAYLRTRVWSPKTRKARMELGSDDGIKVWLNGEVVLAHNAVRPCAPAQEKKQVTLQEGWNDLLLKITQGGGHWEACARFRAPDGSKLEGVRADVNGE